MRIGRERVDFDPRQRRLRLELRHQLRQELRIEVIAGGKAEGLGGGLRIESARIAEQHLRAPQDAARRVKIYNR